MESALEVLSRAATMVNADNGEHISYHFIYTHFFSSSTECNRARDDNESRKKNKKIEHTHTLIYSIETFEIDECSINNSIDLFEMEIPL